QAFAGAATAFFNPASTGLTPMTVSAERLQEANALRGMSMASMQLVGPALAGILIVTVGPGYALAIDAATFGVSAVYLARLRLPLLLSCAGVVPGVAPIILLALKLPWETLVVAALVTGFGNMLFNTLWETTLQQHIPPASLSRVSAYDWFGSLLCQPLGLALAGVVAAGIGMSSTLWIAAEVDLVAVDALLAPPSLTRLRRMDVLTHEMRV